VWRSNNRQYVNKDTKVVYRGLHPLMKATCWPFYSFFAELAKFKASKRHLSHRKRELSKSSRPQDTDLRSRGLGTLVHEQLQQCVRRRTLPGLCSVCHRYTAAAAASSQKCSRSTGACKFEWHTSKRYLCSPVVSLLERLHKLSLCPVLSEHVVCEHSIRLATSIDLICVNYEKKLMILIEVKCGYYDGMMMFSSRKMNSRFSSAECSPYNMAVLQIVCGKQMFMSQLAAFGSAAASSNLSVRCTVAHLTGTSVKLYYVDERLEDEMALTYRRIVSAALGNKNIGRQRKWQCQRKRQIGNKNKND